MGLRERKHEHTRQLMLDAARSLFDQHGYDDTTVEMIADEAGVSARTFYRYFTTKDGVVAHSGTVIVDRAIAMLPARATAADILRCLATATEHGLDDTELEWSVRLRRENSRLRASMPTWIAGWSHRICIALASNEGLDEPSFAHRIRSSAAVHASATAADEWILRQPNRRLSDIGNEALTILADDLAIQG